MQTFADCSVEGISQAKQAESSRLYTLHSRRCPFEYIAHFDFIFGIICISVLGCRFVAKFKCADETIILY